MVPQYVPQPSQGFGQQKNVLLQSLFSGRSIMEENYAARRNFGNQDFTIMLDRFIKMATVDAQEVYGFISKISQDIIKLHPQEIGKTFIMLIMIL
jgi:hypothetical protein